MIRPVIKHQAYLWTVLVQSGGWLHLCRCRHQGLGYYPSLVLCSIRAAPWYSFHSRNGGWFFYCPYLVPRKCFLTSFTCLSSLLTYCNVIFLSIYASQTIKNSSNAEQFLKYLEMEFLYLHSLALVVASSIWFSFGWSIHMKWRVA